MTLRAIVHTYIRAIRPRAQAELDWFRTQPTLQAAIENAAMAVNSDGKRYSHQRRLTKAALQQARRLLLANSRRIARAGSFDELFLFLENLLEPIEGIGELYIYDTALRIGAKLDLLPRKVYVHAGTRAGAKALGLETRTEALEMRVIPQELRVLRPHEVEDVLCIFKSEFTQVGIKPRRKGKSISESAKGASWCD